MHLNTEDNAPLIASKDLFFLKLQRMINWVTFIIVGPAVIFHLKYIRRYTLLNKDEIRSRFRKIISVKKPTLICSNHLTMFDSILIHYVLSSVPGYYFHFDRFSWNVPAIEKFKVTLTLRIITYLGKCIPIDREGNTEHIQKVLNQIKYLLSTGDICTIFPEGGRSRTGKIDVENITYGTGQILKDFEDFRVICLYLRGRKQESYSNLPLKGETIDVAMEVIEPKTNFKGLRRVRDIARQIVATLKSMENDYFKTHNINL